MHTTAYAPLTPVSADPIGLDAAKPVYNALSVTTDRALAANYLEARLAEAAALPLELPESLDDIAAWITRHTDTVGEQYRDYLAGRKAGAPRRYFQNKAQALYFLKAVAPTKLVDGAWLYGVMQRWDDEDFRPLIRIYLEELGDGVPDKNHVLIYRKLLAQHGCEQWQSLPDSHFIQGAIQLALAQGAESFLPELIGYNLGYEQLPLHLLITAYELNELGIDPYYFTLHVTIDNASTGHAHKAAQVVEELAQQQDDPENFYRRIQNGYLLNDLGVSTLAVIEHFDIEEELVAILQAKAEVGQNMHSDYCRFGGKTVNEWLKEPGSIREFLTALQQAGWIKRGEDPAQSRFWQMICNTGAEMFGVFSAYETQILSDWIKGPITDASPRREPSFRALQRMRAQRRNGGNEGAAAKNASDALSSYSSNVIVLSPGPVDPELTEMIASLSPGMHHTPEGLHATRLFSAAVRSGFTT